MYNDWKEFQRLDRKELVYQHREALWTAISWIQLDKIQQHEVECTKCLYCYKWCQQCKITVMHKNFSEHQKQFEHFSKELKEKMEQPGRNSAAPAI